MHFRIETSEHLEQILEFEGKNIYGKLGEILLVAMNNWPTTNLTNIDEFTRDVSAVFGIPTTIKSLSSKYFNKTNAWELESASSLIELLTLSKKALGIEDLNQLTEELKRYFENIYGETDFIAKLNYKTTEEGGRSTPAFSKYRPQVKFDFEEMQTSGEQSFIDKEQVLPGESVIARIRILGVDIFKNRIEPNTHFEFLEGSRIIGTGEILEILNDELKRPT